MKRQDMTKEDAIEINLDEWTPSGGGAQGESYNNRKDSSIMLKLFSEMIPPEVVIPELELSKAVKDAGVRCPDPGRFVKAGNRYGIIFKRIRNKKSFCRAMADDPSCIDEMALRLSNMTHELHSKSSKGTCFKSTTDYFEGILNDLTTLSPKTRKDMERALAIVRARDTETLLHGDFHFGNAITDGKNDYFIDLGAFGYGNPDWDNSALYLLCAMGPDPMLMEQYHIHKDVAMRFWEAYKNYYYAPEKFTDEQILRRYAPYCLLRTLFYERDMGPREDFDQLREYFTSKMN